MITLEQMKKALRISHDALDEDLQSVMDAAVLDMKRVGVDVETADEHDDALINMAVKNYVKWQQDYDNKGDRYRPLYEALRDQLSLSATYREVDGE